MFMCVPFPWCLSLHPQDASERRVLATKIIEAQHSGAMFFFARSMCFFLQAEKLHRHRPQIEKISWTGSRMFAFGSWQGTAGSQRLELTVANVGTTGYHCKELPVPRGWNSWFPTWEPEVTIASNCRLPEVGTHASQPGNHRLPLQRTSNS